MLDYGRQYREYAKEKTLENQKLILKGKEAVFKKSKDIDGGKGVWNSGSLRNINLALDDVLIPFFSQKPYNKKPIHSINRTDIAEFKNWREGLETIRNKPYSPSTINKQNTVLRSIFQFAKYKGEPIGSFRTQWQTAKKHLGWQDEGFSHYSIRHRYAGRRLMNKDVNPLDLANVMGTSLAMISEIYQHYQVEQHYDELVASDIDYRDFVDVYENGIRVKAVRKDSDEHLEIWKKTPEKLEVPPTDYSEQ